VSCSSEGCFNQSFELFDLSDMCVMSWLFYQANYNGEPPGDVEVPFLIDITRSAGRKFGPGNHYGIFDLTVENGEKLSVSTRGGGTDYVNISTEITADEANEPVNLGTAGRVQMQFGGITYVSDYVMIQRRPDGSIDFYLRADESYLGATAEDKEKYDLV